MSNDALGEMQARPAALADPEPIFALDIGTRSIIGVVGVQQGELLKVLDVEELEHPKRAMIDGQIEDIEQTAKIATAVKERLEKKLDLSLQNVCVAAAGRALKTQKAVFEADLESKEPITRQQVYDLEMCAIQEAQQAIAGQGEGAGEEGENTLYCVGYSVVRYYLDDYALSTLLSHRGKRARVEIIATFLPNEVVESLYTAMARVGLKVASITLEPIAAMNAIIPQELRMLNLALVDIGAGTSDIAISNEGSVSAYTMVTVAGDEITETIIREYLVDFATAERMKIELTQNVGTIDYKDILGFQYSVASTEVLEKVRPAVENLCNVICGKILEVNGKPPAAVFLVGGGSQAPCMCELVAKNLSIAQNKVAVGSNNYMKKMVETDIDISGPQYATPMGIAITASMSRERDSFNVKINGSPLRLFKTSGMSVMDILLMSGYKHNQIIGRAGKSVTFEYNHQKKVVRGGFSVSAEIEVNGQPASISTPVKSGDEIRIVPAVPGADAEPAVQEVAEEWNEYEVTLNGTPVSAGSRALLNGQPAGKNQRIKNLDEVEVYEINTLADLCREAKIDAAQYRFLVNGAEQAGGYYLEAGDDIRYFPAPAAAQPEAAPPPSPPGEAAGAPAPGAAQGAPAPAAPSAAAGQPPFLSQAASAPAAGRGVAFPGFSAAGQPLPAGMAPAAGGGNIRVTLNGNMVELPPKKDMTPYQFLDMFNLVDLDPSKPQGNIVLRLNGRDATYLEPIREGDDIDIYWDRQ